MLIKILAAMIEIPKLMIAVSVSVSMCDSRFRINDIAISSRHWQPLSTLTLHLHVHHQELGLHLIESTLLIFRFWLFRSSRTLSL